MSCLIYQTRRTLQAQKRLSQINFYIRIRSELLQNVRHTSRFFLILGYLENVRNKSEAGHVQLLVATNVLFTLY